MRLDKLIEKLNEIYVGNERDMKHVRVMVAVGKGRVAALKDLVARPGDIVLGDRAYVGGLK